jgi:VIT1/CCC1 family predicted Fe2+/Mn2+ transporter
MKQSIKTGSCFGLTSGTITTLGLMVGLAAGTSSKAAVIGGLITIAIADAMSDALGIHISEESKDGHSKDHVWEATATTFFTKLFYALTYVIPVLLFDLNMAVIVNIAWGIFVLSAVSFAIARSQGEKARHMIAEHVSIAIIVVLITHEVGLIISDIF